MGGLLVGGMNVVGGNGRSRVPAAPHPETAGPGSGRRGAILSGEVEWQPPRIPRGGRPAQVSTQSQDVPFEQSQDVPFGEGE